MIKYTESTKFFRNALSREMMHNLLEALQVTDETRVVIIKAAPGVVFSSGHDLNELVSLRTNPVPLQYGSHLMSFRHYVLQVDVNKREKHEEIFRTCTKLMTHIQVHLKSTAIVEIRVPLSLL